MTAEQVPADDRTAPERCGVEQITVPKRRVMPSTDLLRQWANSPDNGQCWGLGEIADELDDVRASLARETNARKELAETNKLLSAEIMRLTKV
jgi:hypothetical protein